MKENGGNGVKRVSPCPPNNNLKKKKDEMETKAAIFDFSLSYSFTQTTVIINNRTFSPKCQYEFIEFKQILHHLYHPCFPLFKKKKSNWKCENERVSSFSNRVGVEWNGKSRKYLK